jgi:hypothetical protein
VVLWNRHKALIEEVHEAAVVGLDDEATPPQVRAPVVDRLDQADELAFIRGKGSVSWRNGPAEEGDRVSLLDKNSAETV